MTQTSTFVTPFNAPKPEWATSEFFDSIASNVVPEDKTRTLTSLLNQYGDKFDTQVIVDAFGSKGDPKKEVSFLGGLGEWFGNSENVDKFYKLGAIGSAFFSDFLNYKGLQHQVDLDREKLSMLKADRAAHDRQAKGFDNFVKNRRMASTSPSTAMPRRTASAFVSHSGI